jgi:hypothetical protein
VPAHGDDLVTFGFGVELKGDFVARDAGEVKVCHDRAEKFAHEAEEFVQVSEGKTPMTLFDLFSLWLRSRLGLLEMSSSPRKGLSLWKSMYFVLLSLMAAERFAALCAPKQKHGLLHSLRSSHSLTMRKMARESQTTRTRRAK